MMDINKDWMQVAIFVFVSGIIAYLVVSHTGTEPGQVKADLVYTFFTGVFATKIVDFAFTIGKKD